MAEASGRGWASQLRERAKLTDTCARLGASCPHQVSWEPRGLCTRLRARRTPVAPPRPRDGGAPKAAQHTRESASPARRQSRDTPRGTVTLCDTVMLGRRSPPSTHPATKDRGSGDRHRRHHPPGARATMKARSQGWRDSDAAGEVPRGPTGPGTRQAVLIPSLFFLLKILFT